MPKRLYRLTRRDSPPSTIPAGAFKIGGFGFDAKEARRIENWLRIEVGTLAGHFDPDAVVLLEDDLQDPRRDRYCVARDPRSILASLCSSLSVALVGASTELAELEAEACRRVAWRKEKQRYLNTIKRLQALGRHTWAEELAQEVKQRDAAHTHDLRIVKKEIHANSRVIIHG